MFSHGETVTVAPGPPTYNEYGDPVPSTRTGGDIPGCGIAPRYSTEPTAVGRHGVIVGLTIYAPTGADILSTDALTVRGLPYVVEGEPGVWRSPYTGWEPGIEIAVKRSQG